MTADYTVYSVVVSDSSTTRQEAQLVRVYLLSPDSLSNLFSLLGVDKSAKCSNRSSEIPSFTSLSNTSNLLLIFLVFFTAL